MAFLPEITKSDRQRNVGVSPFVRLDEDKPVVVQVLDKEAVAYFKYWFKDSADQWVGYVSPGYDECPITQHNQQIGKGNPGYIKPQMKYAVNVIDLTKAYTCPECNTVYMVGQKPDTCTCGHDMSDVKFAPMNRVRILERGPQLFEAIAYYNDEQPLMESNPDYDPEDPRSEPSICVGYVPTVPDPDDPERQMRLQEFALQITRSGTGLKTSYKVVPMISARIEDISDYLDERHDLPQGFDLTPDEVLSILDDRVPLSDVLAARNAEKESEHLVSSSDEDDEFEMF